MTASIVKVLFVLVMPVVMFAIFGYWMMHATGRDQFRRTRAPDTELLSFRIKGYDAEQASAYWQWLGPQGRLADRRLLEADMVFPFLYGGAMLASLLLAWVAIGRPVNLAWLVAPVAITVIADLVENSLLWHELQRVLRGDSVQAGWIEFASLATTTKIAFFYASTFLIVLLAGAMLVRAFSVPD